MKKLCSAIQNRVFPGCVALLCCVVLSGCFDKRIIRSPEQTPPKTVIPARTEASGVPGAEAALQAGQTARAEQLAMLLLKERGLSPADTARTARVLALAATAGGHPYLAVTGLERWLAADPAAENSEEWGETFLRTLGQLPAHDAMPRAQSLVADARKPFALRSGAALFLASRQWENTADIPHSLAGLQTLYSQTPDASRRAQMERSLFTLLRSEGDLVLGNLNAAVSEENSKAYPYAVVRLESFRRKALHAATREEAQAGAAALAQGSALADTSLFQSWDALPPATPAIAPLPGRTLVLALPLTGTLGGIGKKIIRGAEEARREFAASGHSVNLVTLDTQNPAWVDSLAALPADATVVGGPLRLDVFNAARARGLNSSRVFLTFLPGLGDAGEEGRVAWRFFSSPEDQFSALFAATAQLGVAEYAILMPDTDSYAARMADMFTARAQSAGSRVVKRAEYPRTEQEKWNKFVGSFLGASKNAANAPSVSHRAIFLPDAWRNMELIVPNLFYYMEPRQLLLGTSLWEQGLAAADHVTPHYYTLALFPGAWDKTATLAPAAAGLQAAYARAGLSEPDFWAGLGYDFIRFASTLDIAPGWTPESVNAALSRSAGMAWSMAPLQWSATGKASQSLFLFTPAANGFVPADMPAIADRFAKAWNR